MPVTVHAAMRATPTMKERCFMAAIVARSAPIQKVTPAALAHGDSCEHERGLMFQMSVAVVITHKFRCAQRHLRRRGVGLDSAIPLVTQGVRWRSSIEFNPSGCAFTSAKNVRMAS